MRANLKILFLFLFFVTYGCALGHKMQIESETIKVGFGSCVKDPNSPIWEAIAAKKLDTFLLLGDNIYQTSKDFQNEDAIRRLYQKLWDTPGFIKLREHTPLYAVWDDHDYGPNNCDSTYAGASTSLKVFDEYFPYKAAVEGSIAQEITIKGITILLVDDRSFRKNPQNSEFPQLLGTIQLEWLKEKLRHPTTPVILLASGNQWLTSALMEKPKTYESLWQFPIEQHQVLEAIDNSPAEVLLISGDRHFAEILEMALTNRTITEITSSPLSASTVSIQETGLEPRRRLMAVGFTNFGVVTINPADQCPLSRAEIYNNKGEAILSYTPKCKKLHTPKMIQAR